MKRYRSQRALGSVAGPLLGLLLVGCQNGGGPFLAKKASAPPPATTAACSCDSAGDSGVVQAVYQQPCKMG